MASLAVELQAQDMPAALIEMYGVSHRQRGQELGVDRSGLISPAISVPLEPMNARAGHDLPSVTGYRSV